LIVFKEIWFKNFLSYGNNLTKFSFNKGIIRLSGENGKGKSAVLEALNFSLFGKPYRKIKMNLLVNSINKKNLETTLILSKGEDEYRIERGLKPDYCRIYKNDELIPVASSKRGYQDILEQDILHMNENLFNQITVKSLTKNMSFMTLSKAEKRNVIENILDIELFTIISKNIKSKIDNCDFSLSSTRKDISNTELLIEQEISNLERLKLIKNKIDEESKQKVEEINAEIQTLQSELEKYDIALSKLGKYKKLKTSKSFTINELRTIIKNNRDKQTTIIASIKLIKQKVQLFKDNCGDCPKIKEILKSENVDELISDNKQLESSIEESRVEIQGIEEELRKIEEILANEKFINGNIDRANKRLKELEKSLSVEVAKEINIDESILKKHKKNLKELNELFNKVSNDKKHLQVLKTLYSDDGIKSFVIKKYLPHINRLLNTYLRKFHTDIVFNFDQEFNEVVLTRDKEDFSYFSFSEGQKKRIDLAVLFAFINFAQFKNKKSNTNLLILDEILTGLDATGANALYDVLKEYRDQQNKSIVTIFHSDSVDIDNFNEIYEVKIERGFSKIEQIEF